MNLETLPNELLICLFEYLRSVDLICAFYNLNIRVNCLLIGYLQNHTFEFASVSKVVFDSFCRTYLPSIVDRINSIRLSDSYETPHQTDRFFIHGFTFRTFIHLRKLSLCYVRFEEKMYQMMEEAHHLTYLNLFKCDPGRDDPTANRFLNSIWKLPKLKHCCLNKLISDIHFSESPTIISSSLQYLYFCNYASTLSYNELAYLTQSTPNLQYFGGFFDDIDNDKQLLSTLPSLVTLNIGFYTFRSHILTTLTKLFQSMPSMCRLTLQLDTIIEGHHWEQMIIRYMPKLKVFRFGMLLYPNKLFYTEQQIDRLVDSFRTRFWLEEHQWLVRCDWDSRDISNCLGLYTLPYAFSRLLVTANITSKLTSSNYYAHCSYNSVRHYSCPDNMNIDFALSDVRLFNIRKLHINIPFKNNLWTLFPRFDQLFSIVVKLSDSNDSQSQLQTLLDRAPSLYSLGIEGSPSIFLPLIENIHSQSIRQLQLPQVPIDMTPRPKYTLSQKQCDQLSHSFLAMQCQILRVQVDDQSSILHLINTMNNLRALSVLVCDENKNTYVSLSTKNVGLVQWLQHYLPSSYGIKGDRWCPFDIQIWIR